MNGKEEVIGRKPLLMAWNLKLSNYLAREKAATRIWY